MRPLAGKLIFRAVLPWFIFCGCQSTPVEPPWAAEVRRIKVGMTRTEAEALLPEGARVATSFGSTGNQRDFYAVDDHWRGTIVYRAPIETNWYYVTTAPNGQKITNGPCSGWLYRSTPDEPVVAGPFIGRVKSRGSKFVDPFGNFTATVPVQREPGGPANRGQPVGPGTNRTPPAVDSGG
jgi:hypothetical protein